MSAIFPTSPASVRIKLLPKNAEFVSYEFKDRTLKLKAWIPGDIYSFTLINSQSAISRFYEEHCTNCERNTRDYIENLYEHDNLSVTSDRIEILDLLEEDGECTVYFRGENECVNCPLDYTINEDDNAESYPISNSVVVETLIYNDRYGVIFDSAGFNVHLRAADFDENGLIRVTSGYRSANVYSDTQTVCWGNTNGYNRPENLREAATIYFNSEFNNDLLNLGTFKEYNERLERVKNQNQYKDSEDDKFICAGYDALMCIEAQKDVQAFYTMLTAGFRPIPELPNIMFIPLEESSIQKDDNFYFGYLTKPDAVGRQWYVSSEGYLIGQLDESFVKI